MINLSRIRPWSGEGGKDGGKDKASRVAAGVVFNNDASFDIIYSGLPKKAGKAMTKSVICEVLLPYVSRHYA